MSEEQDSYRPKSPDLSGFVPPPRLNRLPSYQTPTDASFPPGFAFSPRGSYDASPYFSPQNSQPSNYFGSQPHSQGPFPFPTKLSRTPSVPATSSFANHQQPSQYSQTAQYSQPRQPPPSFTNPTYQTQPTSTEYFYDSPVATPVSDMARTRAKRTNDQHDADYTPDNHAPSHIPPPPSISNLSAPAIPSSDVDPALTTDVKTKFPVARIKRIMQADEDVGKVAQATPTAVGTYLSPAQPSTFRAY